MSHRPLALVSGLTVGDYLLWNWSLNGSHDVLALVSGLTLPPLAVAFVWLFVLSLARLVARYTRRSHLAGAPRRADRDAERMTGGRAAASDLVEEATTAPAGTSSDSSSGKLAA